MFIILVGLLLVADIPAPPYCWEVRAYVLAYGEAAAIDWARGKGYTQAQIDAIRKKCKR